jgi:signal transduction histidine kinase
MVLDADGRFIAFNGFAEGMTGFDEASLLNKEASGLFSKEACSSQQDHFETKMKRCDDSFIDVELSIMRVLDSQGSTVESIMIARDISRQKIIEKEALAASRSKGEFLAMVSHELRTPLTAIKGSLGIMLEGATGEFNEEQKDFLLTAQRNTDRLEILINNVLDYQRLEGGSYQFKLVPGEVNQVIDQVKTDMELLAQKKNLKLGVLKADPLPLVMMDQERLKRAVRNLVDNAIKFTAQGEIFMSTSFEQGQVIIRVKDTGIGIKPEDKHKLFEQFFQVSSGPGRSTGSLGLGLVIARRIVNAHHGDIEVQSADGVGSTFSICLPAQKGPG